MQTHPPLGCAQVPLKLGNTAHVVIGPRAPVCGRTQGVRVQRVRFAIAGDGHSGSIKQLHDDRSPAGIEIQFQAASGEMNGHRREGARIRPGFRRDKAAQRPAS